MNTDTLAGNWKQLKGKVKERWGRLTDDDLDVWAGKRDQLVGRIQERYGIAKDEAEMQIRQWEKTVKGPVPNTLP
jgi:uncharacterized protein YjbJ (UPF0337 family)